MDRARFSLLFVAVFLTGGCTLSDTEQYGSVNQDVSAKEMGDPEFIEFDGAGLVRAVVLQVKRGWVKSDAFAADIVITSLNGGSHFHGADFIPLSEGTVFSTNKDRADLVLEWTEDVVPKVAGDVYTVCAQIWGPDGPFAPEFCSDFVTD